MGYRGTIRSVSAAIKKIEREKERAHRKKVREVEKLRKKAEKAYKKQEKIFAALNEVYAKGKLSQKEFSELQKRKKDITLDLVVIGGIPFSQVAKRYITGKIGKKEFEDIKREIIPNEIFAEKDIIKKEIYDLFDKYQHFIKGCKSGEDNCNYCNTKKGLFKRLRDFHGHNLCSECYEKIEDFEEYEGAEGEYFFVEPINFNGIKDKSNIQINLTLTSSQLNNL